MLIKILYYFHKSLNLYSNQVGSLYLEDIIRELLLFSFTSNSVILINSLQYFFKPVKTKSKFAKFNSDYFDHFEEKAKLKSLTTFMKTIFKSIFNYSKSIIETETIKKTENSMMRLSKWISQKSLCSKKDAEEFIKLGLVRIDGKRVFDNLLVPFEANMKAFTPIGLQVERPVSRLWMINKPRGYICSHRDPQKRKSIYELLPPFYKTYGHIVSVGRLDFNSEGLLLLTNDIQLKNLLENPAADLWRYYRVKVHGRVTPDKLLKMTKPIMIAGQEYGPLKVKVDRALTTNVWIDVSMKTGKNREIRRIMQKCDLQVNKLIREEYGYYKLGSLKHGEIKEIQISTGLDRKLKLEKAKEITKDRNCLIEIDIRDKSIEIATFEREKMLSMETKSETLNLKHEEVKKLQNAKNLEKETEDSEEDSEQN